MIDVFGIEILKRSGEKLVVTRCVRYFRINDAPGTQSMNQGFDGGPHIKEVFQHVAKDHAIEISKARG